MGEELGQSQIDHMAGAAITTEDIRIARLSMKPNKTCGHYIVVVEMLGDTSAADCHWATAFDARNIYRREALPAQVKLLGPAAILIASVKLWSRTMLMVPERYDTGCSPAWLFASIHGVPQGPPLPGVCCDCATPPRR